MHFTAWQLAPVRFGVLCAALLLVPISGCAAVKATQQPDKKNLGVLAPGTPRSHVIAELGAPTWSEERDGTTVDIFAFKQGYAKGTKAGRALLHGAADVATWGLWEVVGLPVESLADGKDVKVEVTYDKSRRVRSLDVIQGDDVIHPAPMFARKGRLLRRLREPTEPAVPAEPTPEMARANDDTSGG